MRLYRGIIFNYSNNYFYLRDSSDQTINKNKNDTFFNKSWLSKSKYNQHYGVLKKGVDDYHIICACSPFSEIRCGSWQNHKTRNQIHLNWIAKNPPEDIECKI